MTLLEVAASILLFKKQQLNYQLAQAQVLNEFKNKFPYWSFSDWNVSICVSDFKRILAFYERSPEVSVERLIADLPGLVSLMKSANRQE
jgi:hypothetical protein